ncbi:tetrathionate reductase [Shewanella sp. Choline-02u-19]|uniref:NrfD/PsrC family molybdoenzyme membrane anchor subunit n=1 Tax=unclassified Shewanella TaxID=196818 RepID=UPI000C34B3E4|nr:MULTISPECIES: NrfD/PsrC family molybdoenzyme membrane anchor subunit [unclassified Shewanella]PKH57464.1 tetrathionate reductase [Shewanella sp. Bg11-22]PKI28234.1 tetrathionate reductase [Shewanella sp. Choline-02u-19]
MNITEVLVPAQQMAWLPWATQYFFFIGSAYAAAMLFLLTLIFKKHTSHRLRAALVLTLAICAIVGPLALTGDLHQPGRAWHFYAYITPWSWMSMGSFFLPVFSGLSVVTAWLYLRDDLMSFKDSESKIFRTVSKLSLGQWKISAKMMLSVATITVISSMSIAFYTGAEIAAVHARPLWDQPASPLLWFTTAFLGAVGLSLIIWLLFPQKEASDKLSKTDVRLIKQTSILSSILALILIPIWASNNPSFSLFDDSRWASDLTLLAVSILSCAVLVLLTLRHNSSNFVLFCNALMLLAACWITRWITMMEVQTIPKFDVGPYPYSLPMGSSGLLGIVGMIGLWMALAMLASELVQPKRHKSADTALTTH